jgi:hypothetical protein
MSKNYGNQHWLLTSCVCTFVSGATLTKQNFSSKVVNALFEVVSAVSMKNTVFSGAIPCSLVEMFRRFGKPCFHNIQPRRINKNTKRLSKSSVILFQTTGNQVSKIIKVVV